MRQAHVIVAMKIADSSRDTRVVVADSSFVAQRFVLDLLGAEYVTAWRGAVGSEMRADDELIYSCMYDKGMIVVQFAK